MIRRISVFILSITLLLSAQVPHGVAAQSPGSPETTTPVKHLVVLMQENHTFDNYFGSYPGANGIPQGTRMPLNPNDPSAGYVLPWHIGNSTITDLSHNENTWKEQFNNGKMDSFVSALNRRNQDGRLSMGYYDGSDLPYYWNLADHYVLFDRLFSSAKDGSFANHMYWVAAQSPKPDPGKPLSDKLKDVPTIFDRLQEAGISWKYYVQNYDPTITYRDVGTVGNRASQVIWVPLLNFDRFLDDPTLSSHIVDLSQYYTDLRDGTLPAVAFIVPSGASEHPPGSPMAGQRFVKNLVQELMRSDAWSSSAFLLVYDDWGGWYDHVPPIAVDENGYGPHVPGILVSPYAREAHIDSTQLDFTSILKFIEENWGLKSLTQRDSNANNFLTAFNFNQPPRLPLFLSLEREQQAPIKSSPANTIYMTYGAVISIFVLVLLFANLRTHGLAGKHEVEVPK